MKNTTNRAQRGFVVEYKSRRRQTKAGVKSIWGDTDLKAFVRAVTDDMPQSKMASGNTDDFQSDVPNEVIVQKLEHNAHIPVATSGSKLAGASVKTLATPASVIETPNVSGPPPEQKRKRRSGSRSMTKPSKPELGIAARPQASIAMLSDADILSILDMENRRLKELLMKKLRSENILLKEMLQRFEK